MCILSKIENRVTLTKNFSHEKEWHDFWSRLYCIPCRVQRRRRRCDGLYSRRLKYRSSRELNSSELRKLNEGVWWWGWRRRPSPPIFPHSPFRRPIKRRIYLLLSRSLPYRSSLSYSTAKAATLLSRLLSTVQGAGLFTLLKYFLIKKCYSMCFSSLQILKEK